MSGTLILKLCVTASHANGRSSTFAAKSEETTEGRLQIRSEVARHVRGTVRGRVRGLRRGISTGDASESVQVGNRPAHLQCLGRLQGRRVLSWGACWCRRGTSWGRFEGLNSIPVCIRALDMDHLNEPMHSYSQPLPVFSFQACTGARCSHGCRALMRRQLICQMLLLH